MGDPVLPPTRYCQHREPRFNSVFSPPRNQKLLGKNKPEKQTPEVQDVAEAETREENKLNTLRETLLSENHNLGQVEIELQERVASLVLLPEPQESET